MKGYEKLDDVLARAFKQASEGKGAERHANELPFHEQPMQQVANQVGRGFLIGQAIKKVVEAQGLPPERAVAEMLGAINYIAGAVIHLEAQNDNEPVHGVSYSNECEETVEYLDSNYQLVEVTGNMPVGYDWIKVPECAELFTLATDKIRHFWVKGVQYIESGELTPNGRSGESFDRWSKTWLKKILWSRQPLLLTRDQARDKLANMTRDSIEIINDIAVNFDHDGFFTAKVGTMTLTTGSLKTFLNHLFPEAKQCVA